MRFLVGYGRGVRQEGLGMDFRREAHLSELFRKWLNNGKVKKCDHALGYVARRQREQSTCRNRKSLHRSHSISVTRSDFLLLVR